MRCSTFLLGGFALAVATPAVAQDTAPPPEVSVTGGLTIVSDYRLRGVSQTDKQAAVQGTLTVAHKSGFYLSTFASNLSGWGTFGGANLELDGIVGYKHTYQGTTVDGGVTWYTYPGGFKDSNVVEFYLKGSHTIGPVSATVSAFYAPNQTSLGKIYNNATAYAAGTPTNPKKWDNLYLTGDAALAVPKTPITAKAHIGYSKGNPGLGPNGTSLSPTGKYLDWSLGADVAFYKNLVFNVSYIDTDITNRESAYIAPNFRKTTDGSSIAGGTVLASLTASF